MTAADNPHTASAEFSKHSVPAKEQIPFFKRISGFSVMGSGKSF